MAQKVETRLIDDLDGTEAVETVRFSLEGRQYEIDLSMSNASRLRDIFATFIASARGAGGAGARRGRASTRSGAAATRRGSTDRERSVAVRKWAKAHGFEVSSRGRIAADVLKAYDERADV